MRIYRVERPCPELGLVLLAASTEMAPGEQAVVASRWRYVLEDVKNGASMMGLEVVSASEDSDGVKIIVRKVGGLQ